jgi:hypothetical protein
MSFFSHFLFDWASSRPTCPLEDLEEFRHNIWRMAEPAFVAEVKSVNLVY